MATTFDVNRIGGGTFELVQDPTTGKYTVKQVGFTPVKKLSIPDYTTATTTAGTTDTSKATTEATTQTVAQQTTEAFKPTGGGDRIDYTGSEMLSQAQLQKEAAKIDPQVETSTTSLGAARPTMRDVAGETTEQKAKSTFERPTMRDVAGEELPADRKAPGIFTDKTPIGSPFGAFDVTPKGVFSRPEYISTTPAARAAITSDAAQLGISRVAAQPQELQTERFAGAAAGTLADPAEKEDVKPEAPVTGLSKVKTGLETLAKSVGKVLTSGPLMSLAKAAFTETPTQKFDKSYFTDRGDGRIGGNPTTDLYAGFNRVSAFGDLERAGRNRIATREKTIEKKGYKPGDKFYDDTQNMKDQQRDYQKAKETKTSSARERARMNQPGSGGNDSGSSNEGRVICTELNKTG